MTIEDWENIAGDIRFDFAKDNYFTELKDGEIIDNRINLARNMQDMVGKYYSHEWLRKNILQQSEDDIEEQDKEIAEETDSQDPRWINPLIQQAQQGEQQMELDQQQAQMQQQDNTDQKAAADDAEVAVDPKHDETVKKNREAQAIVDLLGKKKNRTMADEAKLKSASLIVSKNK
jgi:hypothetical protein